MLRIAPGMVTRKPITRESAKQAVTPLRRECRMMRRTCGDYACVLFYLHTRLRVQPRTRHSLRPLHRRVFKPRALCVPRDDIGRLTFKEATVLVLSQQLGTADLAQQVAKHVAWRLPPTFQRIVAVSRQAHVARNAIHARSTHCKLICQVR